jgi:hypothetical protein
MTRALPWLSEGSKVVTSKRPAVSSIPRAKRQRVIERSSDMESASGNESSKDLSRGDVICASGGLKADIQKHPDYHHHQVDQQKCL